MSKNFRQVIWEGLDKKTIPLPNIKSDQQAMAVANIMFWCDPNYFILDTTELENGKVQIKLKNIGYDENNGKHLKVAYMMESY